MDVEDGKLRVVYVLRPQLSLCVGNIADGTAVVAAVLLTVLLVKGIITRSKIFYKGTFK